MIFFFSILLSRQYFAQAIMCPCKIWYFARLYFVRQILSHYWKEKKCLSIFSFSFLWLKPLILMEKLGCICIRTETLHTIFSIRIDLNTWLSISSRKTWRSCRTMFTFHSWWSRPSFNTLKLKWHFLSELPILK